MKQLQEQKHLDFIKKAGNTAKNSTCQRSKCGAIIVKDDEIIGQGYNSPPYNLESQRRCYNPKTKYNQKVTDKTCCIHAEQRAIFDALKNNPDKLENSSLYFIRLDENENLSYAGEPYCTICSKMALDVGIMFFILYYREGVYGYDTKEYNDLSYNYN